LNLETIQNTYRHFRGGSRGTPNNCAGEQNSNYLLRKTTAIFALLHRSTGSKYLKSTSAFVLNSGGYELVNVENTSLLAGTGRSCNFKTIKQQCSSVNQVFCTGVKTGTQLRGCP